MTDLLSNVRNFTRMHNEAYIPKLLLSIWKRVRFAGVDPFSFRSLSFPSHLNNGDGLHVFCLGEVFLSFKRT